MEFYYGKDWMTAGKAIGLAEGSIAGVLSEEVRVRIDDSFTRVKISAGGDEPIYGINTGFGPLCTSKIEKASLSKLQENLLLSHSVGVGEYIDPILSRIMLVLKTHSLALGFSGVKLETIDRLIWHIENDVIPCVPEKGSVGASGDLAPLAHLFLPIICRGIVWYKGKIRNVQGVLEEFNLKPIQLSPKEGLALINGTQFILSHAVLLVRELHDVLAQSDIIGAMMIEGLLGSAAPFDRRLHQLRPYRGNVHVASRIGFLLDHSAINQSHEYCEKVQDPYSLRCIPQVHGSSREAWLHLKERVEIEANSVTDNPVIMEDGDALSGGNFHGQPLALALDYAKLATSELGNISDRRIYLSMMGDVPGVPKLLVEETGVNSGFMILQYTSAALASENKTLCFPSSADSIPTSCGQEDHVSMGSISGRKALEVVKNVKYILAIELMCAAQALDFHRPLEPHEILKEVHSAFREEVAFAIEDRYFAEDIGKANIFIEKNKILNIIEELIKSKYGGFRTQYHQLFEVY